MQIELVSAKMPIKNVDSQTSDGQNEVNLYDVARPLLALVCKECGYTGNFSELEETTHGNWTSFQTNVAYGMKNENDQEAGFRDALRIFCASICYYVFAMTDEQIAETLLKSDTNEERIINILSLSRKSNIKNQSIDKSIILQKAEKQGYNDREIIFGETIFERFLRFLEISETDEISNKESRLSWELLKEKTTRGTPRIRPKFRDSNEVARNPYVPLSVRVKQDFKTRFNEFVEGQPALSKAQAIEQALTEFMEKYHDKTID